MSVKRIEVSDEKTMRPLSRDEIEEQIQRLVTEVIGEYWEEQASDSGEGRPEGPRWISAEELVCRVTPFLSHN